MSLGYDRQLKIVALGDSAKLSVFIRDNKDQLYDPEDIAAVTFTIQRPALVSDGKADGRDMDSTKVVIDGEV